MKHTEHNQAPGPQIIARRGQAASRPPIVTTAGPGPEPHPLLPTFNSNPLPAPSWRRRRGSSRRPDRRARATRTADTGTRLARPGRRSGAGGTTQHFAAALLESHDYPTAGPASCIRSFLDLFATIYPRILSFSRLFSFFFPRPRVHSESVHDKLLWAPLHMSPWYGVRVGKLHDAEADSELREAEADPPSQRAAPACLSDSPSAAESSRWRAGPHPPTANAPQLFFWRRAHDSESDGLGSRLCPRQRCAHSSLCLSLPSLSPSLSLL